MSSPSVSAKPLATIILGVDTHKHVQVLSRSICSAPDSPRVVRRRTALATQSSSRGLARWARSRRSGSKAPVRTEWVSRASCADTRSVSSRSATAIVGSIAVSARATRSMLKLPPARYCRGSRRLFPRPPTSGRDGAQDQDRQRHGRPSPQCRDHRAHDADRQCS
jgi:hypothetical protein